MYLHKDREMFKDMVEQTAEQSGRTPIVVEKDYYVTLILKLLSEQLDLCVFKGGTSLSKGYHVINRFSRRKKLKNVVLKGISEELEMPIANWNETQSDRDYNAYFFSYTSVFELEDERLPQYIKLETALGSYAFPTQSVEIHNYIGDYLEKRNRINLAKQFSLDRFSMNLQSLERTYIDKIFALCDYYMQGKSKRYSRHLYDVYKLTPLIDFDNKFVSLVKEIREHRAQMTVCPSAKEGVDVSAIITEFCDNSFYEEDYQSITSYFTEDFVSYEDTIKNMRKIIQDISF